MKKILFAWMLLLGLGSTLWIEQATAVSFTIRNNDDWNKFRDEVQKSRGQYWVDATLEADITTGGGVGIYEDTPYRGTFNGNGHTLTVDISRGDGRPCALFCYAGDCTIKDLHVRGRIYGGMHSAGLIGIASGGTPTMTIDRVWVSTGVNVAGSHGGGFIGHSNNGNVYMTDCRFDGSICTNSYGGSFVGEIIGWCNGGGSWKLKRVYDQGSTNAEYLRFCLWYNGDWQSWGTNDGSFTVSQHDLRNVNHYNKTDQTEVVKLMNANQADSWVLHGGLAVPKKFESEGEGVSDLRVFSDVRWQTLSEGSSSGKTLQSGRYYVTKNISFTNSSTGSGLTIAPQSVVYIHVPKGVTLTATGGDASGRDGAGAGILLPWGSTLYLEGEGTVVATGGNAANGANGKDGDDASCDFDNMKWAWVGGGGPGGNGGGGAGAGIGTAGGAGGAGGSAPKKEDYYSTWTENGIAGSAGSSGRTANAMGQLYVSNGLNVEANGGGQGKAGSAGRAGKSCLRYGAHDYSIPGGGGGGAGGFGGAATGIGTGGPGGGGGGGGAKGSHEWAATGFYKVFANGGKGGRNGDGSNAGDGGTAGVSTENVSHETCSTNKRSWVLEKERGKSPSGVKETTDGGDRGGCGFACRQSELKYQYVLDYKAYKSKGDPTLEKVTSVGYKSTESRKEIAVLIPSPYSMGLTKQDQYLSQWYSESDYGGSSFKVGDKYIIRQGSNTLYSYFMNYRYTFPKGFGSKTDPFIIEDAMLLNLVDYVNSGYNTRNVYFKQEKDILVSNILKAYHRSSQWTPIGYDIPFEGDYDGGGFCIRDGEIGSKADDKNLSAVGIFGKVLGAVHNVGVENITVPWPVDGDARCGTLAGMLMGDQIEQCAGQISNCYVVKSHVNANYGGVFLGAMEANTSISYCHEIGNGLQGGHAASFSSIISSNAKVDKCFTGGTSFSADGYNKATNSRTRVSSSQMASGEITWLLNDRSPFGVAWRQDIDIEGGHRDAHPVLNAASAQVYCDNNKYSNNVMGPLTVFTGKGTANEPFLISSMDELTKLGEYCNNGNRSIGVHFRQTADIDCGGRFMSPIGYGDGHIFEGIYDGDGHTIRNGDIGGSISVGVFGEVTGKVTHLAIEGMTIKWNSSRAHVGGIAGRLSGNGEISNCLVKDCTVTGHAETGVAGGIVADMLGNAVVRNSLAYNNTVSAASMGSICAEMLDAGTSLMRCYTDGKSLVNSKADHGTVSDSYPGQNTYILASGAVAYGLNGGVDNPDPIWFQNLNQGSNPDLAPVFQNDHAMVFKIDDVYTNDGEQLSKLGEGTAENPYKIGSPEDLKKLIISIGQMRRSNFHVLQTADIDLRDSTMVPIGTGTAGFEGHYDGGGYVVRNINMHNYYQEANIGLFNNILGTVERLGIEKGTFKADGAATRVGAIAGKLSGEGVLRNCFVKESTVDFNFMPGVVVGALVGEQTGSSRIESCYGYKNTVAGQYDGQSHYGHIVGYISGDAAISHAYTDGPSLCADRQSGADNITDSETDVSAFRFNSGALCYQLNGSRDNGTTWRQKLLADAAPVTNPGQPSVFLHTLDYQSMFTNTNDVPYSARLTLDPNHDDIPGTDYELFEADDSLFVPTFKLAPYAESQSRLNYEFVGWNTQPDGKGDFYAADGELTPKEAMTLYALWGLKVPAENDENGKGRVVPLDANTVYYKIYDEGGHSSPYGYDYKGKLTLSAPSKHFILLGGTVSTEAVGSDGTPRDYMVVYDGDYTKKTKLANEKGDTIFFSPVNGEKTDIGMMMSSGNEMTIEFVTDDTNCFDGLDLTVAVLPSEILTLNGTGTKDAPFQVANMYDLLTVDNYINTTGDSQIYIKQVADIDMEEEVFTPLASGVKSFEGHYDGGGFEIQNMVMTSGGSGAVGLFHNLSGTVEHLGIVNSTFTAVKGDTLAGSFAGRLTGEGQILNCYAKDNTLSRDKDVAAAMGALVGAQADSSLIGYCLAYHNAGTTSAAGKRSVKSLQHHIFTNQDFTDEQFASGEVCHRLNGGKTDDGVWRQTLGIDNVPGFSNLQGVVYTYRKNDETAYSNTNIHRPQYYISNAEEFRRFVGQDGDIYLTQDIDLDTWNGDVRLRGNFDGGGHTITYYSSFSSEGFFREVCSGASLKHLRLDGSIMANHGVSGITQENRGTITDCHFNGNYLYIGFPLFVFGGKAILEILEEFGFITLLNEGTIDHCSTTCNANFALNNKVHIWPISKTEDGVSNCTWIDPDDRSQYSMLKRLAAETMADYPVYAQGIIDAVGVDLYVDGTRYTAQGRHLPSLTLYDGRPFVCPAEVKVDEIIYERQSTGWAYEPWVLPFAYTIDDKMIRESGETESSTAAIEFYRFEKDSTGNIVPKLIERGTTYQVAANEPLAFRTTIPADTYYQFKMRLVKNGASQPLTIQMPKGGVAMTISSPKDEAFVKASYEGEPAYEMNEEALKYVWNNDAEDFILGDGQKALSPFRYYLQYADKATGNIEPWEQTDWARRERRAQAQQQSAPRRASRRSDFTKLTAEGWQPIIIDYDNVTVTEEMLNDYEILALSDIYDEATNLDGDDRHYAVTVIYEPVEAGTELLVAHPLLVRAKRADVAPLPLDEAGSEVNEMMTWALENGQEDKVMDFFEESHLWCATFAGRYDVWQLPMPERNSLLNEAGALIFNNTGSEPYFYRVGADDGVFMQPMSYCFTAYDEQTYENLPLDGDRINVVVLGYTAPGDDVTGINDVNADKAAADGNGDGDSYNLQGQKVGDSYRGIVVKNGRKMLKR